MKRLSLLIMCLVFLVPLTGCVKTYTYQVERKDQSLSGNRGYVMGETPEPVLDRKRSRTMVGVDVELPPSKDYKAQKETLEEGLIREEPVVKETEELARRETIYIEPKIEPEEFITEESTKKEEVKIEPRLQEITYKVQKGDTLEKISKRFLGKASRWPEIYEANKDTIKEPSRVYPGQVITVPQDVIAEEAEIEYK